MASCSNYSLLLISSPTSSIPNSSKVPILSSMIHSRRQPPVVLKEKSTGGGYLGFSVASIHLLQRNSWFGSIRRRCNKKGLGSEGEGDFALEAEIEEEDLGSEKKIEKEEDDSGINGILKRLEKMRNYLSFGFADLSCKNDYYDDELKLGSSMSSEIGLDVNETAEERSSYDSYSQTGENWFRSRVQHLELELASTLRSLKSASEIEIDISSPKGSDNPSDDFSELSDAWEFKETEVMNAKNKLRSIRAKLAILEAQIDSWFGSIRRRCNKVRGSEGEGEGEGDLDKKEEVEVIIASEDSSSSSSSTSGREMEKEETVEEDKEEETVGGKNDLKLGCDSWKGWSSHREEADDSWMGDNWFEKDTAGKTGFFWKIYKESEISLNLYQEALEKMLKGYFKNHKREREERMNSVFVDIDQLPQQPPVFLNSFEEEIYQKVYDTSRSWVEVVAGPLKVLFKALFVISFTLVRLPLFVVAAFLNGVFRNVPEEIICNVIPNAYMKWSEKHKTVKYFYPKPPKQPRPKPPQDIIDAAEYTVEKSDFDVFLETKNNDE